MNSGLSRIVASSSSKMKHLVAAAPDQAYTVYVLDKICADIISYGSARIFVVFYVISLNVPPGGNVCINYLLH